MRLRIVLLASVCSVFLAASAAASGASAETAENKLVSDAYQALQSGDAAFAVTAYGKAIESRTLEPEVLANALVNRGLAYQRLNEHEFAIDDYTAALRIDAMSGRLRALALYNRGLSYQRLQRDALAMEDFTSALFLDGQFSHAYYSRGTLLRDGGQYLFALADFDKALRFDYPDPARVYVAQSATFEKLNRIDDAREALKKALAASPGYEPALKRLAVLDGEPRAQLAEADSMQTAAVTQAADDTLPAATAPSHELAGGEHLSAGSDDAPSAKLFTDRVPQEVRDTVQPPAEAEERILAVENVPEDQPAPATEEMAAAAVEAPAEVETPAAEEPAAETRKITGWSVQLASATTEDAAWSTWKKMKARNKVLAGKEPVVVRADLGSKGVFYRVRLVGFESQGAANSECSKLKSRGVKCFISKAAS
jgi:tetratricopeptide (TPR) repeat protein